MLVSIGFFVNALFKKPAKAVKNILNHNLNFEAID